MSSRCRFGYEEHDGDRYCFEHFGFWHYTDPIQRCSEARRGTAPEPRADELCPVDKCSLLSRGAPCPNQVRRLTVVCSSCLPGRPCFACAPSDNAQAVEWPSIGTPEAATALKAAALREVAADMAWEFSDEVTREAVHDWLLAEAGRIERAGDHRRNDV